MNRETFVARIRKRIVSIGQLTPEEEKVSRFYEVLKKQPNEVSYVMVILYMFLFVCMIVAFIPAQVLMEEGDSIGSIANSISLLFCIASWVYMSRYQLVSDHSVTEKVINKLIYMPLRHNMYRKYLFRILIKYLLKVTTVGLVIQIVTAFVAFRQLSVWNILYIICPMFVVPLIVNAISIVTGNGMKK